MQPFCETKFPENLGLIADNRTYEDWYLSYCRIR